MNSPEQDSLEQQLTLSLRRLGILEERAATYGSLHAPPEIIIEIEDLKQRIDNLRRELSQVESVQKLIDSVPSIPNLQPNFNDNSNITPDKVTPPELGSEQTLFVGSAISTGSTVGGVSVVADPPQPPTILNATGLQEAATFGVDSVSTNPSPTPIVSQGYGYQEPEVSGANTASVDPAQNQQPSPTTNIIDPQIIPDPPHRQKQGLEDDAIKNNISDDTALKNEADDKLDFTAYVEALWQFISHPDTTTPCTIGIDGEWGSGKSSLMGMLQTRLENTVLLEEEAKTNGKPLTESQKQNRPDIFKLWKKRWDRVKKERGDFEKQYNAAKKELNKSTTPKEKKEWLELVLKFNPGRVLKETELEDNLQRYLKNKLNENSYQLPKSKPFDDLIKEARPYAKTAMYYNLRIPEYHPTVWFNAWQYSGEEQIWSALALEVIRQLTTNYPPLVKIAFWFKLSTKRFQFVDLTLELAKKFLPSLIIIIVTVMASLFIGEVKTPNGSTVPLWLGYLLAPFTIARTLFKITKDPFKIETKNLLDSPNYKDKVGFIARFEEDFKRIVDIVTNPVSNVWQPQKLVIFIDDLDRCKPLQAAGIIEAINLILNKKQCVFILGMDFASVSVSIEAKYKELTEKIRKETPGVVSPGSLFLDKIIQIPLHVPRPEHKSIKKMVRAIMQVPEEQIPVTSVPQTSTNTPTSTQANLPPPPTFDRFATKDVTEALLEASEYLSENPRQVKRFINLFRLQIYIANNRGLLINENTQDKTMFTPLTLAIWVAWCIQWPILARYLTNSAYSYELRLWLGDLAKLLKIVNSKAEWELGDGSFEKYIKKVITTREEQKTNLQHIAHLPWEWWSRDADFKTCIKTLASLWDNEEYLNALQYMSKEPNKKLLP